MSEQQLKQMFPYTARRERKKIQRDNTPDDSEFRNTVIKRGLFIASLFVLCLIGIAMAAYFGQKYGW
jgi:hypothetical protein